MPKQIGIMGGTFNPIHLGHLRVAQTVYEAMHLDEIWFMPNYLPAQKQALPAIHRQKMVELALIDHPHFFLNTMEIDRAGITYTYDTMMSLHQQHADNQYYFIIGADEVNNLPTWYRIDDLITLVTFVGVNRPKIKIQSSYPVEFVDGVNIDISSSVIRKRLQSDQDVHDLLPDSVYQYIIDHQLYQKD